ncbi:rod shape-determining protein MreC [Sphingomonas sp. ABOLD]|uniref:Cell shape-determining protein MreC n=1 Tax=Sphingomonas trueperi TaxID=53317 RepID=A0A7X5XYW0_9SPHN|nr:MULTISPECIES: rod shape-determining protein MreC [Sphingomonas]NJB97914.1 rod shape-determining protein MreC [Sphingomonas trueperi]RSV40255.1 rod shape-determining protein MreC [Sphingomonas sp. ABOLD]
MAPPRNRRPGFSRRAQYGLFFSYVAAIGLLLIGGGLVLVSRYNPHLFAALRSTVAEVTTPVSSGLDTVRRGVGSVPTAIGSYFGVRGENARLKRQIEAEHAALQRALGLERENQRLRQLLKVRDATPETIVVARLVNSSASSTRRYATLNAGSWQRVSQGQPVRDGDGLIGQVVEAGPNASRVLLITDPDSTIPVRRASDGLPAIVTGKGDGTLDVRAANAAANPFRAGDLLVTSGTGGVFPPNIPLGKVSTIGRDSSVVTPASNPDMADFVMVLRVFLPEPAPPPQAFPTPAAPPKAK